MPDTVHCDTHGETQQAFVCSHLAKESRGRGFHHEGLTDESPYPDAWCDDCEVIRAAHGGWTDESQELITIKLICSGCYERTRIRNTNPTVTLDDLANLRWKRSSCEEWHAGPILDLSMKRPAYWSSNSDPGRRWSVLSSGAIEKLSTTFLDSDYCVIDDRDFLIRGLIHLPIVGTAETFRWGVWGSVSRENFEALLRADGDPSRAELPPMFSWLSSQISDYPNTLNLKMHAHIQEPGTRPHFQLERADHPLAKEFHEGILPSRVKEIMFRALPPQAQ